MMEAKFIHLRDEFLSAAQLHVTEHVLHILKEHYAQCIDSNRKSSQIKDLRTLLKILEKRDALSCNNIEPFVYISNNYLSDNQIQSKIEDYNCYLLNRQYSPSYTMYQELNDNKDENKSKLKNITENDTSQIRGSSQPENQSTLQHLRNRRVDCSERETELQQILLSHISERIGRSWRDTVRFLGIPEYQIDVIQSKHAFDLKEQSYEALKLYMTQYSNRNWKTDLICALEKARRRDLGELVEKLIFETYR